MNNKIMMGGIVIIVFLLLPLNSAQSGLDLKIGIYENFPLIFTNEDGEAAGLYADVLNYIAKQEDWNLEYVHGTFPEGLTRLENNEIDVMTAIAFSEKRSELYDFSEESVFLNWGSLYVASDSEFTSIFDLEGKKVAVLGGDIYYVGESAIINLLNDFEIQVEYVEVDSYVEVFELVERGDVAAGVVSRTFGNLEEGNHAVKPTGEVFNSIEIMFAFPKDFARNVLLKERFDFHMLALKDNPKSIYHKSLETYFGGVPVTEGFPVWITWAIVTAIVLASLIGFVVYRRKTHNKLQNN